MLFVLTGASAAGKSTVGPAVDIDGLEVHDSDEAGVPSDADSGWRQAELERWVQRALTADRDLLLLGQSPLGEVLAVPSATDLDGIAVALLDVTDEARCVRLERRRPGAWSREAKHHALRWARWHRRHAVDPGTDQDVLTASARPDMRWDRWTSWLPDDPRGCTDVIDTTDRRVADSVRDVTAWIARVRSDPQWPLLRGWSTG